MFVPPAVLARKRKAAAAAKAKATAAKRRKRLLLLSRRKAAEKSEIAKSAEDGVPATAEERACDGNGREASANTVGTIGRYNLVSRVGEGRFGQVHRAVDTKTGESVAVKALKTKIDGDRGFPTEVLRELAVLSLIAKVKCPHIVAIREVAFSQSLTRCFLVTDLAPFDLAAVIEHAKLDRPFEPAEVKSLMFQLFDGLNALHRNWILHRDIKVQNMLLTSNGTLQICDFGSARRYGDLSSTSVDEENTTRQRRQLMTPNLVSGHYRSPELLIGSSDYGPGVDIWAAGCIMGELLARKTLFPGTSEFEQMRLIQIALGTPTADRWPAYAASKSALRFRIVRSSSADRNHLREMFPQRGYDPMQVHNEGFTVTALGDAGFDIFAASLRYDPTKRITAAEVIEHPWFSAQPRPKRLDMKVLETRRNSFRKLRSKRHVVAATGGAIGSSVVTDAVRAALASTGGRRDAH
eukprot:g2875.t1